MKVRFWTKLSLGGGPKYLCSGGCPNTMIFLCKLQTNSSFKLTLFHSWLRPSLPTYIPCRKIILTSLFSLHGCSHTCGTIGCQTKTGCWSILIVLKSRSLYLLFHVLNHLILLFLFFALSTSASSTI